VITVRVVLDTSVSVLAVIVSVVVKESTSVDDSIRTDISISVSVEIVVVSVTTAFSVCIEVYTILYCSSPLLRRRAALTLFDETP
jgi:hypothetical protein